MALNIGSDAVAFSLPGVDDKTHALDDFKDKDVLAVFFSCNHCPYVLAWEDRIIAAQADYADKGVQFVAIGSNDAEKYPTDNFENMKVHSAEKGFNFPYLHDASQEIAKAYGAERTPEIFIFDKDRKLRYHGTIDDNYENPEAVTVSYLRNALDAVLAGNEPETAETAPVGCTIKWK